MAPGDDDRRAKLDDEMRRYKWYHTVDLGNGLVTPGEYDHRPILGHYGLPDSLAGKTVLDVGPAHGFFAFEFEERGAARVVTVELPKWSAHDAGASLKKTLSDGKSDSEMETYLHGALDFAIRARRSRVERQFFNVYDLSPEVVGSFDITFCGSLLIHLTDPLRALSAIRSVTREYCVVATVIDSDPASVGARALFYGTQDGQAFWAPNMTCLERWAICSGFRRVEHVSTFQLLSPHGTFDIPHGAIRAYV
jgi:tRNA (mo5U34)-methyltransferase